MHLRIALLLLLALPAFSQVTFLRLAGSEGGPGWVDGQGSAARLNAPMAAVMAPGGDVFVADTQNHVIRRITTSGEVSTFAGLAGEAGHADGRRHEARFHLPSGIARDANGNLFVSDAGSHVIRMITPDGRVSTFAGMADSPGAAGGTGSAARFNAPKGLAFDGSGNLYVADSGSHTIRKITPRQLPRCR
jgi:DNA-binding beta-propeller fold protein YncE